MAPGVITNSETYNRQGNKTTPLDIALREVEKFGCL